ncbi:MAG TPA: hypothetical protein VFK50_01985 [Sphingomicrobium sp.]|nr:hypothetical protein [Sphingomicrobium sp.]
MKLFKKEERDPIAEQALAYRLSVLANRAKSSLDPYGRNPDSDPIAA